MSSAEVLFLEEYPPGNGIRGAESAPGSVSGDRFSSDTIVPVYSGERLTLCVGEADRNLENDLSFAISLTSGIRLLSGLSGQVLRP